jgi:quinol monooxygenase YgiN
MPLYTFVRFDPVPGKEQQLRDELLRVLDPTRAEPGCLRIHLFESTRGAVTFIIHSECIDEADFDAHAKLPHMTRFLAAVRDLVTNPLQAVRTSRIA